MRLSTRAIDQIPRSMTDALAADVVRGGYWLRAPGPNCEVVIAYTGAVAPEAIQAAGLLAEDRRDIGLLAVTSADLLFAGCARARKLRTQSHVSRLLGSVPRHSAIVTVVDGHPSTLAWLGGVAGHRVTALGVDAFGQSGSIGDLYSRFGLDVNGIIGAVEDASAGRPVRYRTAGLAA